MVIQLGIQPRSFVGPFKRNTNLRRAMCEAISSPDKVACRVKLETQVLNIFVGGVHTVVIT